MINEEKYVELFINGAAKDTPWFIMFYKYKCPFCKSVKPEFEKLAEMSEGQYRVGMINGHQEELLKESYDVDGYPRILFIKDYMVYRYPGVKRKAQNFYDFINGGYKDAKEIYPVRPIISQP